MIITLSHQAHVHVTGGGIVSVCVYNYHLVCIILFLMCVVNFYNVEVDKVKLTVNMTVYLLLQ